MNYIQSFIPIVFIVTSLVCFVTAVPATVQQIGTTVATTKTVGLNLKIESHAMFKVYMYCIVQNGTSPYFRYVGQQSHSITNSVSDFSLSGVPSCVDSIEIAPNSSVDSTKIQFNSKKNWIETISNQKSSTAFESFKGWTTGNDDKELIQSWVLRKENLSIHPLPKTVKFPLNDNFNAKMSFSCSLEGSDYSDAGSIVAPRDTATTSIVVRLNSHYTFPMLPQCVKRITVYATDIVQYSVIGSQKYSWSETNFMGENQNFNISATTSPNCAIYQMSPSNPCLVHYIRSNPEPKK